MTPWIIIVVVAAAIVYGIDFIVRRKKWKDNSKGEIISLLISMLSVGPHAFLSILSLLWGIVSYSPETAFGELLYNGTLVMGSIYFIFAIAATISSFVLRKKGKVKASIWVHVIEYVAPS